MTFDVRIRKVEGAGTLLANANVTIDGKFAVNGFKIVQGKEAPFVSMPTGTPYEKEGKKEYPEVFFPVTKESREELINAILAAYNAAE